MRPRVSVLGLILDREDVLLIHKMDPLKPDRWDLPGGGLEWLEPLMDGLAREIQEETGVTEFRVDRLLTLTEKFFHKPDGTPRHMLNVIYQCSVPDRSAKLYSQEAEVGEKGIQWLPIAQLTPELCTTRTWKALQAAGLRPLG